MKRSHVYALLLFCLSISFGTAERHSWKAGEAGKNSADGLSIPLFFEANTGQSDERVKFLSRGSGYSLLLTSSGLIFRLQAEEPGTGPSNGRGHLNSVLGMRFVGANSKPDIVGTDPLSGLSHYFGGNDPSAWHTGIRQYGKVKYRNLYPGIELVFHGDRHQLEYDLVLAPGVDPGKVVLALDGAVFDGDSSHETSRNPVRGDRAQESTWSVSIDREGALLLKSGRTQMRHLAPVIYQEIRGKSVPVSGRYVIKDNGSEDSKRETASVLVGFEIDAYDSSRPLVIDPQIVFSTEVRGNGAMSPSAFVVDAAGNIYVGGGTNAPDLPRNSGLQPGLAGGFDAYVTKLSPQGAILFSVYLGGSADDRTNGIAVDGSGNIYLAGATSSSNFPTRNPIQPHSTGTNGDVFVAKLNSTGTTLLYSTFLGGAQEDSATSIAVDASGSAYITGTTGSTAFPLRGAFQSTNRNGGDLFVSKLDASGSALVYSSFLGGTGFDSGPSIALDGSGSAYIAAFTQSTDFPTVNPFQATNRGSQDAVVVKVNPAGSALVYSTYLGGDAADRANGIAVDASGNAYVAGNTSSRNFPTANPFQAALSGTQDAFIAKLSANGSSLVYSSYLGGSSGDSATAVAIDPSGHAYLTGGAPSTDFPLKNPLQTSGPAFLAKITTTGSEIEFSTYLGTADMLSGFGVGVAPLRTAKTAGGPERQDLLSDFLVGIGLPLRNNSVPLIFQIDMRETTITATEEFVDNCIRIIDPSQNLETNGAVARTIGGKLGWRVTTSNISGRLFGKIQEAVDFVGVDQAAHKLDFKSGDTVQLGPCNFTESVILRKTHSTTGPLERIALAGSGKGTQIIDPGADPVIDVFAEAVVLTSFRIDGTQTQNTLIRFREGNAGTVTNVDLNNTNGYGIFSVARKELTVSGSKFETPESLLAAVLVEQSSTLFKIGDNTSINGFKGAVEALDSKVSVDNGLVITGVEFGVKISRSDKVTIRKLQISRPLHEGIEIEDSKNISIQDTEVTDGRSSRTIGLELAASEDFTVGPRVRLTGSPGIGLVIANCTSGKNVISGSGGRNQFNGNDAGVLVLNSRVEIIRNTISLNKSEGLRKDKKSNILSISNNTFFKNGRGVSDDLVQDNFKAAGTPAGEHFGALVPDRIESNVVIGNTTGGLQFANDGNVDLGGGAAGSAGGNIIALNGGFDLTNGTGSRISARNNIWDNSEPGQILSQDVSAGAGADVTPVMPVQSIRFAQFVEAPGFTSRLTLINPSRTNSAAAVIAFRNASGAGTGVILNGVESTGGRNGTVVAPLGAETFSTNSLNPAINVGSMTTASGRALAGTVLFSSAAGVAGVGQSDSLTQFIAPVERNVARSVNSGLAVTNPNTSAPVTLQLRLKDGATGAVRSASLDLAAGGQVAKFVDELFAGLAADFSGTLSVTAGTAVAATVIRTSPGQFATLPVTGSGAKSLLFAQFGEAVGLSSTMTFVNPSADRTANVTVRLFDDNGSPLTANLGGIDRAGQFTFAVAPQSASTFTTPGTSSNAKVGSVVVDATENIGGTLLFGGSFGLAGVGNSQGLSNFVAPVEQTSQLGVSLGLALMNAGASQVTVRLTLRDDGGTPVTGGAVNVVLPARGHAAKFLAQLFPALDLADFVGTITGETSGQIGATVIRQSTSPLEFATLPVAEIVP